ncbi:hypothetical protein R3X28_15070 [Maribacter sp. TH_r10]|uniref:hypothetical protein n=1 Tax=Maribacter sp. TH_r10 TaxID=3082086 RepID=UPI0029535327|nr:hypothetical protein [Maribacter sp. TH_r10]MDV7140212.1 hypothetical protein [Maribacter sp. TH_r10]
MHMNICVIGSGAYGSYTIDALLNKYPNANITLFDVGDATIKSEKEIGYLSNLKRRIYKGLSDGRYFGFGGATDKWGGQLLTFTKNDFKNPNRFLSDVIKLNEKYKDTMLQKFNITNEHSEKFVTDVLFTKTGVWLSAFNRNFFKIFKIQQRKQVTIISNARVSHVKTNGDKRITKVYYIKDGIEKSSSFDFYFLTAGAFESARILLSSDIIPEKKVYFSDHLSQKIFKIKKSTYIGKEDFVFKMKGFSLITKRLIGEYNNCSFYVHPVFNMDFPFFQSLKTILFKKQITLQALKNIIISIPQAIGFAWTVLVHRRIYVYKNEWFLYIDIDNPTEDSFISLSKEKDAFGIRGLDVTYSIGEDAAGVYKKAKDEVIGHLTRSKVDFEVLAEEIDVQNTEDIYHPHKMFLYDDMEDYYTEFDNMLLVNTGILPRSGGINPTAALLPLIDEFINEKLINKL